MSSEVLVVDFWANGFGMRVRIALEEKGIEYKYMEEDLRTPERSSLVQEMNPVYKSVPVLIHGGRPICDSLVILQYIDEAWKVGPTLLPQDPHQRAHARFWSDLINKKVFSSQTKFLKSKGEDKEAAKQELIEDLKLLEAALGDEPYFGGEYFGFLDSGQGVLIVDLYVVLFGPVVSVGLKGRFRLERGSKTLERWSSISGLLKRG
ncbi:hypothetical protein MRB53_020521 [Persea americana]|uniref:Uncharacterized protein n=1 Tax=Persea americana TaxID=3435 RepID=A0ACC2L189_PERAE|nr:hypothetical protein MRB53_020521 [Persea americana]